MRHYHKGELVGEREPQVPLRDWLRAELDHVEKLDPCPYVYGRRAALREVTMMMMFEPDT